MKAIILSLGTRGDIEPFLAIAELLKENNWDVVCVFPEQFRTTVEQMGMCFKGFDKAFLELLEARDGKEFMEGKGSILKRARLLIRMARRGIKLSRDIVELQHNTLMDEKPDRVIYHPKCNFSLLWGMCNPGKSIMVSPMPGMAHRVDHHTVIAGNYGTLLNRLGFWLVNLSKAAAIKVMSRKYKSDYPDLKITVFAIKKAMLQKEKSLYTISPSLFARPSYWPDSAKVVGYYERNKTVKWLPSKTLCQFLDTNINPILITFGSMSTPNPEVKTDIIVRVLKKNKIPCIINTSWGGLTRVDNCPDHIFFTDDIPYDWIFPKLFAVVHHGGSGTTHTALKYACPCLIVPHAVDQFYWAKTISILQLGPNSLPIKRFNERDFEVRVLDLIQNKKYGNNARVLSEKMKKEVDRSTLYHLIAD